MFNISFVSRQSRSPQPQHQNCRQCSPPALDETALFLSQPHNLCPTNQLTDVACKGKSDFTRTQRMYSSQAISTQESSCGSVDKSICYDKNMESLLTCTQCLSEHSITTNFRLSSYRIHSPASPRRLIVDESNFREIAQNELFPISPSCLHHTSFQDQLHVQPIPLWPTFNTPRRLKQRTSSSGSSPVVTSTPIPLHAVQYHRDLTPMTDQISFLPRREWNHRLSASSATEWLELERPSSSKKSLNACHDVVRYIDFPIISPKSSDSMPAKSEPEEEIFSDQRESSSGSTATSMTSSLYSFQNPGDTTLGSTNLPESFSERKKASRCVSRTFSVFNDMPANSLHQRYSAQMNPVLGNESASAQLSPSNLFQHCATPLQQPQFPSDSLSLVGTKGGVRTLSRDGDKCSSTLSGNSNGDAKYKTQQDLLDRTAPLALSTSFTLPILTSPYSSTTLHSTGSSPISFSLGSPLLQSQDDEFSTTTSSQLLRSSTISSKNASESLFHTFALPTQLAPVSPKSQPFEIPGSVLSSSYFPGSPLATCNIAKHVSTAHGNAATEPFINSQGNSSYSSEDQRPQRNVEYSSATVRLEGLSSSCEGQPCTPSSTVLSTSLANDLLIRRRSAPAALPSLSYSTNEGSFPGTSAALLLQETPVGPNPSRNPDSCPDVTTNDSQTSSPCIDQSMESFTTSLTLNPLEKLVSTQPSLGLLIAGIPNRRDVSIPNNVDSHSSSALFSETASSRSLSITGIPNRRSGMSDRPANEDEQYGSGLTILGICNRREEATICTTTLSTTTSINSNFQLAGIGSLSTGAFSKWSASLTERNLSMVVNSEGNKIVQPVYLAQPIHHHENVPSKISLLLNRRGASHHHSLIQSGEAGYLSRPLNEPTSTVEYADPEKKMRQRQRRCSVPTVFPASKYFMSKELSRLIPRFPYKAEFHNLRKENSQDFANENDLGRLLNSEGVGRSGSSRLWKSRKSSQRRSSTTRANRVAGNIISTFRCVLNNRIDNSPATHLSRKAKDDSSLNSPLNPSYTKRIRGSTCQGEDDLISLSMESAGSTTSRAATLSLGCRCTNGFSPRSSSQVRNQTHLYLSDVRDGNLSYTRPSVGSRTVANHVGGNSSQTDTWSNSGSPDTRCRNRNSRRDVSFDSSNSFLKYDNTSVCDSSSTTIGQFQSSDVFLDTACTPVSSCSNTNFVTRIDSHHSTTYESTVDGGHVNMERILYPFKEEPSSHESLDGNKRDAKSNNEPLLSFSPPTHTQHTYIPMPQQEDSVLATSCSCQQRWSILSSSIVSLKKKSTDFSVMIEDEIAERSSTATFTMFDSIEKSSAVHKSNEDTRKIEMLESSPPIIETASLEQISPSIKFQDSSFASRSACQVVTLLHEENLRTDEKTTFMEEAEICPIKGSATSDSVTHKREDVTTFAEKSDIEPPVVENVGHVIREGLSDDIPIAESLSTTFDRGAIKPSALNIVSSPSSSISITAVVSDDANPEIDYNQSSIDLSNMQSEKKSLCEWYMESMQEGIFGDRSSEFQQVVESRLLEVQNKDTVSHSVSKSFALKCSRGRKTSQDLSATIRFTRESNQAYSFEKASSRSRKYSAPSQDDTVSSTEDHSLSQLISRKSVRTMNPTNANVSEMLSPCSPLRCSTPCTFSRTTASIAPSPLIVSRTPPNLLAPSNISHSASNLILTSAEIDDKKFIPVTDLSVFESFRSPRLTRRTPTPEHSCLTQSTSAKNKSPTVIDANNPLKAGLVRSKKGCTSSTNVHTVTPFKNQEMPCQSLAVRHVEGCDCLMQRCPCSTSDFYRNYFSQSVKFTPQNTSCNRLYAQNFQFSNKSLSQSCRRLKRFVRTNLDCFSHLRCRQCSDLQQRLWIKGLRAKLSAAPLLCYILRFVFDAAMNKDLYNSEQLSSIDSWESLSSNEAKGEFLTTTEHTYDDTTSLSSVAMVNDAVKKNNARDYDRDPSLNEIFIRYTKKSCGSFRHLKISLPIEDLADTNIKCKPLPNNPCHLHHEPAKIPWCSLSITPPCIKTEKFLCEANKRSNCVLTCEDELCNFPGVNERKVRGMRKATVEFLQSPSSESQDQTKMNSSFGKVIDEEMAHTINRQSEAYSEGLSETGESHTLDRASVITILAPGSKTPTRVVHRKRYSLPPPTLESVRLVISALEAIFNNSNLTGVNDFPLKKGVKLKDRFVAAIRNFSTSHIIDLERAPIMNALTFIKNLFSEGVGEDYVLSVHRLLYPELAGYAPFRTFSAALSYEGRRRKLSRQSFIRYQLLQESFNVSSSVLDEEAVSLKSLPLMEQSLFQLSKNEEVQNEIDGEKTDPWTSCGPGNTLMKRKCASYFGEDSDITGEIDDTSETYVDPDGQVEFDDDLDFPASPHADRVAESMNLHARAHSFLHLFEGIYLYHVDRFDDFYTLGPEVGSGGEGQVRICMPTQIVKHTGIHPLDVDWKKVRSRRRFRRATDYMMEDDLGPIDGDHMENFNPCDYAYAVKITPRKEWNSELNIYSMAHFLGNLRHPNVLYHHAFYQDDKNYFSVMNLAEGPELLDYLESLGENATEGQCREILRQILEALAYIHSQNLIHRDIKPDNFVCVDTLPSQNYQVEDCFYTSKMQSNVPRLLLIDFGIACYASDAAQTAPIGTPMYMAPEVFMCSNTPPYKYDRKIDIWAAGVILCQMLTGRTPFDENGAEPLIERVNRGEVFDEEGNLRELAFNNIMPVSPGTDETIDDFEMQLADLIAQHRSPRQTRNDFERVGVLELNNQVKPTHQECEEKTISRNVSLNNPESLASIFYGLNDKKNSNLHSASSSNSSSISQRVVPVQSTELDTSHNFEAKNQTNPKYVNMQTTYTNSSELPDSSLKLKASADMDFRTVGSSGSLEFLSRKLENTGGILATDTRPIRRQPTSLFSRGCLRLTLSRKRSFGSDYIDSGRRPRESWSRRKEKLSGKLNLLQLGSASEPIKRYSSHPGFGTKATNRFSAQWKQGKLNPTDASREAVASKPKTKSSVRFRDTVDDDDDCKYRYITIETGKPSPSNSVTEPSYPEYEINEYCSLSFTSTRPRSKSVCWGEKEQQAHLGEAEQARQTSRNKIDSSNQFYRLNFDMDGEEWAHASILAKDMVRWLLTLNPEHRPTAKEALQHPWFQTRHPNTPRIPLTAKTSITQRCSANRPIRSPRRLEKELSCSSIDDSDSYIEGFDRNPSNETKSAITFQEGVFIPSNSMCNDSYICRKEPHGFRRGIFRNRVLHSPMSTNFGGYREFRIPSDLHDISSHSLTQSFEPPRQLLELSDFPLTAQSPSLREQERSFPAPDLTAVKLIDCNLQHIGIQSVVSASSTNLLDSTTMSMTRSALVSSPNKSKTNFSKFDTVNCCYTKSLLLGLKPTKITAGFSSFQQGKVPASLALIDLSSSVKENTSRSDSLQNVACVDMPVENVTRAQCSRGSDHGSSAFISCDFCLIVPNSPVAFLPTTNDVKQLPLSGSSGYISSENSELTALDTLNQINRVGPNTANTAHPVPTTLLAASQEHLDPCNCHSSIEDLFCDAFPLNDHIAKSEYNICTAQNNFKEFSSPICGQSPLMNNRVPVVPGSASSTLTDDIEEMSSKQRNSTFISLQELLHRKSTTPFQNNSFNGKAMTFESFSSLTNPDSSDSSRSSMKGSNRKYVTSLKQRHPSHHINSRCRADSEIPTHSPQTYFWDAIDKIMIPSKIRDRWKLFKKDEFCRKISKVPLRSNAIEQSLVETIAGTGNYKNLDNAENLPSASSEQINNTPVKAPVGGHTKEHPQARLIHLPQYSYADNLTHFP